MAGKVFIHIGTSKTGTTSIQRAMVNARGWLRRTYSVNYPWTPTNHMILALPFLDGQQFQPVENHRLRGYATPKELNAAAARLMADLRRDAGRLSTHVLSAEQLQPLGADSLGRMKRFFDDIELPVTIIVYVRHPAERASSLICQRVRSGRYSLGMTVGEDDVLPALKTYVGVFGKENVIVRPFDRSQWQNGRLIDDFTATFHGTPIPGMDDLRNNESLSLPAVLIADKLFDVAPLPSGRRGPEEWLHRITGPKFMAPRSMVEQAVEAGRECLEYIDREFGIRLPDVDLSQFPEKLSYEFSGETLLSLASVVNEQVLGLSLRSRPKHIWRPKLINRLKRRFAFA